MNDTCILAPSRCTAAEPPDAAFRARGLAALRGAVATWGRRMRFRGELERMLKGNPHLIADIGLTRRQAEDEVAKRFWQTDLTEGRH